MDSKTMMEFEISSDSRRFIILAIFCLIALSVNAAERVKLWFRDDVTLLLSHSFYIEK
jgi:hypothetical protein